MPEWLTQYLDPDQLAVGAAGLIMFFGAVWQGVQGFKRGKPTSAAVAQAVSGANCQVLHLNPTLKAMQEELTRVYDRINTTNEDLEKVRELMIRIEDRTRNRR